MPSPKPWSAAGLRARCRQLRDHLEAEAPVLREDLAAYWPRGAENPHGGLGGWIYCYSNYVRLLGEREQRRRMAEGPAGEAALLEALAARPQPVLVEARLDGAPISLRCYPKSYEALRWMAHDDQLLAAILDACDALPLPRSEVDQAMIDRALAATVGVQQRLVWAATHPDAGLPYDPLAETPDAPAEIRALTPLDVASVLRVYRTVNQRGLEALPPLTATGEKRASWSMFFAAVAQELGEDAAALMRERPLSQLIIESRLASLARTPPDREAA